MSSTVRPYNAFSADIAPVQCHGARKIQSFNQFIIFLSNP